MVQTNSLAKLYAESVIRGERTYLQVPKIFRPQVKDVLTEKGYDHLVIEEETPPEN